MAKSWSEVESSPEYQALPDPDKQSAKQQYFDTVVSQKPEFQALPDEDKASASGQFFGASPENLAETDSIHHPSIKSMFQSAEDLSRVPVQSLLKTATGKGFEDRMTEDIPKNTKDTSIPEMLGNNLKRAAMGTVGEAADMITSPAALAGPVMKGVGMVGEAIPAIRNTISRMALNPEFRSTASTIKYGQDGKRVMQTMPDIVGNDVYSTLDAVNNKLQETGQAIGDTMVNHPNANVKLDATDAIIKPFDEKIAELNKIDPKNNRAAVQRLKNAKNALLNETNGDGQIIGSTNIHDMTPKELFDFRVRKIDPNTRYTGKPSDDEMVNSVFQDAKANVRKMINDKMPELKPLNQDYGDLHAAGDALEKLKQKADNEGLPKLDIQKISKIGFIPWIGNPINRINLARWLYTAPKAQIAQVAQQIPGFQAAVQNSYGGFKNASLVTPTGLPSPASKIGLNRALPSPGAAGTVDASVIQQPGYVPPGLPAPPRAMLRPGRALPSPAAAGQSSGPVINQEGFVPAGRLPSPQSVSGAPEVAPSKAMPIKDAYGSNAPISLPGKVDAAVTRPASTPAGKYLQDQMMAKERLPLHPMEDLKAEHGELYSPQAKQNIARNLEIDPEQVNKLADIADYFDHIEPGTKYGMSPRSGGAQKEGVDHWSKKSDYPDYIQSIGPKRAKGMIKNALDGKPVTEFQKKVFKKLLKDYGSI